MTWQPVYLDEYPFQRGDDGWLINPPKDDWDAWKRDHPDRCRDCGKTGNFTAGGARDTGAFWLCNGCAAIDDCRTLDDGRHASHWGHVHTPAEHQDLDAAQDRRRAAYERAHPEQRQEALF